MDPRVEAARKPRTGRGTGSGANAYASHSECDSYAGRNSYPGYTSNARSRGGLARACL